ncbi:MAG: hypothetical protein HYX89_04010 [Chloroflexi bacterium]|nr:hypothetical protein [Chloroflexota bacterium]
MTAARQAKRTTAQPSELAGPSVSPPPQQVKFAHPSERAFAQILDFYQVEWLYEPQTFPLQWDAEGRPIESFTPDFYLPELDLYIELTTLRQSLVTKKNRKLHRLRELYPGIRIKLFYARDVRRLLRKYGMNLEALSAAEAVEKPAEAS